MLSHFGKQQLNPIQSRYRNEIDSMCSSFYRVLHQDCVGSRISTWCPFLYHHVTLLLQGPFSLAEAGRIPAESHGTGDRVEYTFTGQA